jgi:CRP-like cAMP-binding protein
MSRTKATTEKSSLTHNKLLDGLPKTLRNHLLKSCELVNFSFGNTLCEADQPFEYAYFPVTGFISLIVITKGHKALEINLIGNEGMLGATLALGLTKAPLSALVQGSGTALRISAARLRHELRLAPGLTLRLHQYIYVLFVQLAQSAACIHFHSIEQRLARWLLMTQDRTESNQLHLTQEFLADMLGVRRSSITIAAGILQARNIIDYSRGEITILDRAALEQNTCECYQATLKDYANVFN